MRIGVNIPDDLLKRIEPLKPALNVSQICREAIKAYADSCEARARVTDEGQREAEAQRLFLQDDLIEIDWEAIGWQDGEVWAKTADLEDFEDAFHNFKIAQRKGADWKPWEWPGRRGQLTGLKNYATRRGEHGEWFQQQCELHPETNPFIETEKPYTRGWLAYAGVVWGKIQNLREERRNAWREAVEQARQSRPEPEIPRHIADKLAAPDETGPTQAAAPASDPTPAGAGRKTTSRSAAEDIS